MTFFTKVDRRSRRAMAEFLAGHFRYDTLSSWNNATSYANNIKIHNVVPAELQDKAYELLELDSAYEPGNEVMDDFAAEHNYGYQIGANGRSGGYLVLYTGGRKPSQHKRICRTCGQRNFQADATICGRCQSTNMHDFAGFDVYTDMAGIDDGATVDDFMDADEWSMDALRDRVELVQSFDRACDDVVAAFIGLCENFEVTEEEVLIPSTVKVLTPIHEGTP